MKELLLHLQDTADKVPEQSINGYGLRQIDMHVIAAARSMKSYKEYKEYFLKTLDSDLMEMIERFAYKNVQMKYKLRLFALKKRIPIAFWIIYHRGA